MVLVEDKHYQIIPDKGDEQAWNVRILSGTFTETVLKFGVVKFNGKGANKTSKTVTIKANTQSGNESVRITAFINKPGVPMAPGPVNR